jgi:hypothetical protein
LLDRLVELYPAAAAYEVERDPPVHQVAKPLIEEGAVERDEVEDRGQRLVQ